ncbi:MAG: methyl-accepting chemotaxis protein [Treponema sp.]|nr:methyl-accepting chemotaxis protein [Treponema sp.]
MSLSRKIAVKVAIPMLVLFVLIFTMLNNSLQTYIKKSEQDILLKKADSIELQIMQELNTITRVIKDAEVFIQGNFNNSEAILDTLTRLSGQFPDTNGFYAGFEDGRYIDGGGWIPDEGWNAKERDWYISAKNAGGTVFFTEPYLDSQTNWTCISIAKAFNGPDGKLAGVISFDYYFNLIQAIIEDKLKADQSGFIINDKSAFVYHKDYSVENSLSTIENGKYSDFSRDITSGSLSFSPREFLGNKFYFTTNKIDGTDWHLVFGITKAEMESNSHKIMNVLLVGFIILFLILVGFIFVSLNKSIKPLKNTAVSFKDISAGNADLTKRIESLNSKDEISDVVSGFNQFVEKLQAIVSGIKTSNGNLIQMDRNLQDCTRNTAGSIDEIIGTINEVGKQIVLQSQNVEETSGAVDMISQNVEVLDRTVKNQSESVSMASSAVEEMIGNITSVNTSVSRMYQSFEEFNQQAQTGVKVQAEVDQFIKQIIDQSKMLQEANSVIASIAAQTNLLAMNAAIESAHAGEAGKGFGVVADEIRKLSETSSSQSKTIGDQLANITQTIENIVEGASSSSKIFSSVSEKIQFTSELVRQIKAAMDEQEIGSKQILDSLRTMSDATTDVQNSSSAIIKQQTEIAQKVSSLLESTSVISSSVDSMGTEAQEIEKTGNMLSEISSKMQNSISIIGEQIDEFKV